MKNEYIVLDFKKAKPNPHVGKFIKNGRFTIVVEHGNIHDVIEVEVNTGRKTKQHDASNAQLVFP